MTRAPSRIVLINDLAVAKGGATGLTLASAVALRQRGHDVTLLTGDAGRSPELEALGVEIVGLGQERLMDFGVKAMLGGLYNRKAAAMVAAWIARNDRPDVVYHLHGWAQILSPAVFTALRPVADRLVLSAHDFFIVCPNGAYAFLKSGTPCELKPMGLACVTSDCDRRSYVHKAWRVARQAVRQAVFDLGRYTPPVLAIHEGMRAYLERGGVAPASITTVPNPVRPFVDHRVASEKNREFIFIGRLEEGKGPDLACAAAEKAGVVLRLVGDGPMRAALQARYSNAVFTGRKTFDEIAPLAAQARALVMPSRYPEPYGLVAAEALWSGLPVISADTAFLTKDIVRAGAGLSVAPRDIDAFAHAMTRISSNDSLTLRMSTNAFEQTRTIGLTLDEWIDALLSAYAGRLTSFEPEGVSSSRRPAPPRPDAGHPGR